MSSKENRQDKAVSKQHQAQFHYTPSTSSEDNLTASQHGILHLQRTIGNQATSALITESLHKNDGEQVINRSEVSGPFNKNSPVHEVLTLLAIKEALAKIKSREKEVGSLLGKVEQSKLPDDSSKDAHQLDTKKIDPSAQQFIRGVVWPDDPRGYLFDDDKTTQNYSSGAMWTKEFFTAGKGTPEQLIARSHNGNLQFFHGMATADNEDPKKTKEKILAWSRFLTDVSTGQIDPNLKLSEIPLTAELFPAYKDITIKKLFCYEKAKDEEVRQRAAGALMHLVQDSNAEGHVERDAKTGDVKEFHSYTHQDHDKHGAKDKWAEGKTLGDRVKNTPGAQNAIEKCAQILFMLDQGATTDMVIMYLDEEVFKLDPDAKVSGPGEFKQKKATKEPVKDKL